MSGGNLDILNENDRLVVDWTGDQVDFEQTNLLTHSSHRRILRVQFLSATEYHSDADYNSRRVGVVVVVVVVVHTFKNGLTFERLDRFASYLEGSCTRVSRFAAYAYVMIRPTQPAQPAYQPKSEKCA